MTNFMVTTFKSYMIAFGREFRNKEIESLLLYVLYFLHPQSASNCIDVYLSSLFIIVYIVIICVR